MKFIRYVLLLALFVSCSEKSKSSFESNEFLSVEKEVIEEIEDAPSDKGVDVNKKNIPPNRKIIWTASLEIQVKDIDKSQKKISELIDQSGGFVSEMKRTNKSYQIDNRVIIRVPSDKFGKLLDAIKSNGLHTRKMEVQSNDVTKEFVDIKNRLKTKEEVRNRYINILKTRTGKISEVLEVEEAIRVITEEIEVQKGRLRYLKDQVSLSTINVLLYQVLEKPKSDYVAPSYWSKAKDRFISGWEILTSLLLALINIWPLLLILILYFWKRKWFYNRLKSKKQK